MRIEVYVPDHEEEVLNKIRELKKKRRLSAHIVDLLRREDEQLTKEQIIELIKQYTPDKNTTVEGGMESSIQSIFNALR